ncbi:hypothetical protein [Demequina activiva]|uniref:PH domain-containing protein n=1 Tax=Demequina activiva TaxID=1582364 RepID=A0A919Q3H4_9MICO|nr:hypothetical protein [Demequina activiva]GIG55597.1 hypothetical protein Dac01nite_23490 [Demequina activiva]
MTGSGSRARRFALIRPARLSRVLTGSMAVVLFAILFMLSLGAGLGWTVMQFGLVGLLFHATGHQGAWLTRDAVVLETVLGRARIPVDQIQAVHMRPSMAWIMVETDGRFVTQSVATAINIKVPQGRPEQVEQALAERGIPLHWHEDLETMLALQPRSSASFQRGAIIATLVQPAVWSTVVVGALVVVLLRP